MNRLVDRAILLSRVNYGEADRIVTALTSTYGKITLMAKGVRRPKSKLAGGVELFTVAELSYIPGKKGMGTLVSSKMVHSFEEIVKRYEVSQDMFAVLKWLSTHLEDDTGQEYYSLAQETLDIANRVELPNDFAYLWFFIRALDISGHGLEVFRSSDGSKLVDAENYIFDHDTASFIPGQTGLYQKDHIKLLRLATSVAAESYIKIGVSNEVVTETRKLVELHVQLSF